MTGWLRDYWARLAGGLALAVVAAVTGVISYTHIYRLSLVLHQPVMVARLMPFGVDGLIVVGSVVLLQAIPGQEKLGWLGVAPGVAASLFANVESGIRYGALAAGWAGVPAVSFALATFLLERWLKAQAGGRGASGSDGTAPYIDRLVVADSDSDGNWTALNQCPHGVPTSLDEAVQLAFLHTRDCLDETPSQRHLSARFGMGRRKVAQLVGSLNGSGPVPAGDETPSA